MNEHYSGSRCENYHKSFPENLFITIICIAAVLVIILTTFSVVIFRRKRSNRNNSFTLDTEDPDNSMELDGYANMNSNKAVTASTNKINDCSVNRRLFKLITASFLNFSYHFHF